MSDDVLLFDLDGTLYPSWVGTEREIIPSLRAEVRQSLDLSEDEAVALIRQMSRKYGYSIKGLIEEQLVADPVALVERIYGRIDRSKIQPRPQLTTAFSQLGATHRVVVLTNSSRGHAEDVLRRLELHDYVQVIFGIQDIGYELKPARNVYLRVGQALGVDPAEFIYFDDSVRNLHTAWKMGSRCILVGNGLAEPPYFWENHLRVKHLPPDHIESTFDLPTFLHDHFLNGSNHG
jgi:putative hydrolase of the HAD superfamily